MEPAPAYATSMAVQPLPWWEVHILWIILVVSFIILELFLYLLAKGLKSPSKSKRLISMVFLSLYSLVAAHLIASVVGLILGTSYH